MKRKLTQKQLNFAHEYIKNGGNGVQAALTAYDTDSYQSATKIAGDNLKNPYIQKAIEATLSKKEITLEKIVGVIDDGLRAELGGSKLPDHNTRLKFVETTVDLLDLRKSSVKKEEKIYSGVLSIEEISSIREKLAIR